MNPKRCNDGCVQVVCASVRATFGHVMHKTFTSHLCAKLCGLCVTSMPWYTPNKTRNQHTQCVHNTNICMDVTIAAAVKTNLYTQFETIEWYKPTNTRTHSLFMLLGDGEIVLLLFVSLVLYGTRSISGKRCLESSLEQTILHTAALLTHHTVEWSANYCGCWQLRDAFEPENVDSGFLERTVATVCGCAHSSLDVVERVALASCAHGCVELCLGCGNCYTSVS